MPKHELNLSFDANARRAAFKHLHASGCFVIPNPWDAGSARYLRQLGFMALATTSSGHAFSLGLPDEDEAVPLEPALRHIAEIVAATDLPVNADFKSGYAKSPEAVAENVGRCVQTGVAGLSIEDSTADPARPLFELTEAVERVQAARAAIDATGASVLLTARAECYLVGHAQPLKESIRRLQAYAEAGADVLYAPGPTSSDDIAAIVTSVAPKPVNVLAHTHTGPSVSALAQLGARRISVGSALARAAWSGFDRAARAIAEQGSFAGFEGLIPSGELNSLFAARIDSRR
jgi:2-methylisocitrate lyase-like PEP mutase family enzyme